MVASTILSVAGCGSDGETGKDGGAGRDGGAAGGSAGTSGAAGTGTAGTGAAGTGTAGTGAAGTGAAGAVAPFEDVTIPAALAAPAGTTRKFRAHAKGVQIYKCVATVTATDGGTDGGADGGTDGGVTTYAWTLKAPMADLTNEMNQKIGTHYAGPTWKSTDGSDIIGERVASVDSTLADAIPWLLLKVSSHMGAGVFADVTYVQRVNTRKGKAPATGCDAAAATAATEVSVDYTADYWFYTGGVSTDGGVVADWPFTTVTIPAEIAAPAGPTVKVRYHALGVQIYTCTGTAVAADGGADAGDGGADAGATTYAWVLKAPDAKLYDDTNTQKGTHGAGPNWTSTDGSIVTGTRLTQANSPLSDAIPWLLLQAATHTGTGIFTDVTYIQRVNTTLGKAPATGCDAATVNTEVRVDYTADYYFLSGAATGDGGAG